MNHSYRENLPNISDAVCDELGLTELFDLKSSMLGNFFTSDIEVIKYRQQTMQDIVDIPELKKVLSEVHPILDDIRQLRRLDTESSNAGDSYLYSITEIELYVTCIETLRSGFMPVRNEIAGTAFSTLALHAAQLIPFTL